MVSLANFKLHHAPILFAVLFPSLLITVNGKDMANSNQMQTMSCPIAFSVVNNSCLCNPGVKSHTTVCGIDPHSDEQRAYQVYGSCISLDNSSQLESEVITALCPFTAGKNTVSPGTEIPKWPEKLHELCEHFNRAGRLCEKCSNSSYGVDALSVTFDCIPCTDSIANWFKYFTVKLIPTTLFFVIVIFFHIGVTSAAVNGFILYSQIITLPIYALMIESGMRISLGADKSADTARSYTQILTAPLSIWSLDFDFFKYILTHNGHICLGQNVKIIHILALEYISAIYPLLLLLVVYGIIKLYSRNYWPLVHIWRACTVFNRFRRQWNFKTSLIDSFATFFLLSYTKFVFVSMSLLTPSEVAYISSDDICDKVTLFYDPSVEMYSAEHQPYAALAFFVLVVCNLASFILFLYPFKVFQRILNCCSCCPSLIQAIHTFADVFQGCFKYGTNGDCDCRHFAGIYFMYRTVIISVCMGPAYDFHETFTRVIFVNLVLVNLILIMQPYKHHFFNCLDALFVSILVIHSVLVCTYFSDIRLLHTWSTYTLKQYFSIFALLFAPLAYFICFMCYWSITHLQCTKKATSYLRARLFQNTELAPLLNSRQCIIEPDRLENPERYEEVTGGNSSIQDWETSTDIPTY